LLESSEGRDAGLRARVVIVHSAEDTILSKLEASATRLVIAAASKERPSRASAWRRRNALGVLRTNL